MQVKSMRRFIGFAAALLMIAAIVISPVFAVAELDHDCDGEHCEICSTIDMCIGLFKAAFTGIVTASALALMRKAFSAENRLFEKERHFLSPVELKTRLNN